MALDTRRLTPLPMLRRGRSRVDPNANSKADLPTWTAKLVGEALVDALKWAQRAAGRVGPQGMVTARMPEAILTLEQRLGLGWDRVPVVVE